MKKIKKQKIKLVRTGYVGAMAGIDLCINTTSDEMVTVNVKDRDLRWDLYCKHVRITIEEIDENEITN